MTGFMKKTSRFATVIGKWALPAVLMTLPQCAENGFVYDNPLDKNGTNYRPYTLSTSVTPNGSGSVSVNPLSESYKPNQSVTVQAIASSGYEFTGWSGASTSTNPSVNITMTDNKTLTANFQQQSVTPTAYTITFNANNGTVSPTSGTTGADGKLASLPTPTRSGYTFDGWYMAASGGNAVNTSTVFSGHTTIYAHWTQNSGGGGTGCTISGYNTVKIGTQTWMAENLNCDVTGSKCYGDDLANCARYGRLYNWSTAMNGSSSSLSNPSGVRGVCPVGWHLPSDAEWTQLTDFVGSNAGTKLKSSQYWNNYDNVPKGTNDYEFSALPGGYGISDGGFDGAGDFGSWWSATEYDASYAWGRHMYYDNEYVYRYDNFKTILFSVRCLQD